MSGSEAKEPSFDPPPIDMSENLPPAPAEVNAPTREASTAPAEATKPELTDAPPPAAPEPGQELSNPAQPLAPTVVPEPASSAAFITPGVTAGYPKTKFHPVHGAVELKDANEEAGLMSPTDWFNTPEEADAARTWTEANIAGAHNTRAKMQALDEAGRPIVRNSVQADMSIRSGKTEPL